MREYGLWDKIKLEKVRDNLKRGIIKKEEELVGDTTHYIAYSGFEVAKYVDDKGKEQKKSQSKVTKNVDVKIVRIASTNGNFAMMEPGQS